MPVKLRSALVAAGVLVATCGCAANGGVDAADLEQQLLADLLPEHPGLVASVTCPNEIKPESGDQVGCVAVIGQTPTDVTVTFGTKKGVATAAVDDRLVDVVELNRLAAERLSADLELPVQLECPFPVVVLNVEEEVTCTAIDQRQGERDIGLMVDEAGLISLRLQ